MFGRIKLLTEEKTLGLNGSFVFADVFLMYLSIEAKNIVENKFIRNRAVYYSCVRLVYSSFLLTDHVYSFSNWLRRRKVDIVFYRRERNTKISEKLALMIN